MRKGHTSHKEQGERKSRVREILSEGVLLTAASQTSDLDPWENGKVRLPPSTPTRVRL